MQSLKLISRGQYTINGRHVYNHLEQIVLNCQRICSSMSRYCLEMCSWYIEKDNKSYHVHRTQRTYFKLIYISFAIETGKIEKLNKTKVPTAVQFL